MSKRDKLPPQERSVDHSLPQGEPNSFWVLPYQEALHELQANPSALGMALYGPVPYHSQTKNYDQIMPVADAHPLPLDPSRAFVEGIPAGGIIYERVWNRVKTICDRANLTEFDTERLHDEVQFELSLRLDRNHESMQRLRAAIHAAPDVDEFMLDIVRKARSGDANMEEMARLIKEYPEMISLEVFKFTKPLSWQAAHASNALLDALVLRLQTSFQDAEVTPYMGKDAQLVKRPFFDKDGMLVVKHKIGDIRSEDSHTEFIRRHTYMVFEGADYPKGIQQHMVEIGPQNARQKYNLQPISTTAYLRAADYKEREGYVEPEDEQEVVMEDPESDSFHIDVCRNIGDTAHRAAYLVGVEWAKQNLARPDSQ